tara:strand:+ start:89 stop:400 length:312 start_codon:yes stop_codon:yes gene_type:complete
MAVRKLLVVMEVEEKRAAAAMLLPARAPMRLRSLGMEERRVLVVSQPRETKVRKKAEARVRKTEETKAEMRPVGSPRKETGLITTTLVARAEQARNPRRPQRH